MFCALFGRLCANAATVGDALEALAGPRRRPRASRARRTVEGGVIKRHVPESLDFKALPDEPGVYIFRNAGGQVLYVGKSVALRTRARAHFHCAARADGWTAQAALVDHKAGTPVADVAAFIADLRARHDAGVPSIATRVNGYQPID